MRLLKYTPLPVGRLAAGHRVIRVPRRGEPLDAEFTLKGVTVYRD